MVEQIGGHINFIFKPAVMNTTFSKGSTVTLDTPTGHDLEIVSFFCSSVNDGTVASRVLDLAIFSQANGGGSRLLPLFYLTTAASDNKVIHGGKLNTGSYGTGSGYVTWGELIVPSGGSLKAIESNYVAGDSWNIQITYRDIPVNLIV